MADSSCRRHRGGRKKTVAAQSRRRRCDLSSESSSSDEEEEEEEMSPPKSKRRRRPAADPELGAALLEALRRDYPSLSHWLDPPTLEFFRPPSSWRRPSLIEARRRGSGDKPVFFDRV
jgi:hypothetical protein